ncbi:hypothetical protein DPV78_005884 [Talaromyces pinophilus]|nr:hypothetical protein DPV78_005884 [Talaromyces pinophilus]
MAYHYDKAQETKNGENPSLEYDQDESELSPQHREYLLQRHGTLDLDPMPSADDADPYNWPLWKKRTNLVLVAFHAMMGTFTASAIIPAYLDISKDLGVSLQKVSYLTSIQIVVLGYAPLFWKPISNRYGRRSVFLISLIGSLVFNVACAKSRSYASVAACRALQAFFISPAGALGSAVVAESVFKAQSAQFMGVWTLMVTLGIPSSPFILGFVVQRVEYHWVYWILAIINAVQFILYIFFGPETRYIGRRKDITPSTGSTIRKEYLTFHRIDPEPLRLWDFIQPFTLFNRITVVVPAIAYAMVFVFSAVLTTVEIPQLLQEKFALSTQGIGLQFLPIMIGSVLGEQAGGPLSDFLMKKRHGGGRHRPQHRLWLSYIGYILTIIGLVVFLVQTQNATTGKWNVTPLIGLAITAFGNQLITTVLITFAVDCNHDEAASVGVYITLVRQTWGFIGPFWFPSMFASVGVGNSGGIACALIFTCSVIPTILLQWRGQRLSSKSNV